MFLSAVSPLIPMCQRDHREARSHSFSEFDMFQQYTRYKLHFCNIIALKTLQSVLFSLVLSLSRIFSAKKLTKLAFLYNRLIRNRPIRIGLSEGRLIRNRLIRMNPTIPLKHNLPVFGEETRKKHHVMRVRKYSNQSTDLIKKLT